MEIKKIDYILILKVILIFIIFSAVSVFLFAAVLYFLESGYEFSPLFATISIAIGCFASAFYLGSKIGKNGILIGISVAGIVFIIATLVTLLVNSGAVSIHILLRFVILMLASLIGAIIGVNRKDNQKYI